MREGATQESLLEPSAAPWLAATQPGELPCGSQSSHCRKSGSGLRVPLLGLPGAGPGWLAGKDAAGPAGAG